MQYSSSETKIKDANGAIRSDIKRRNQMIVPEKNEVEELRRMIIKLERRLTKLEKGKE